MSTDPSMQPTESAATSTPSGETSLEKVAKAMALASQSIRVADTQSVASNVVAKTIYTTCYCVSYGIIFPTMLVASFIPTNNVICHGLTDGAQAAADSVYNLRKQWAGTETAAEAGNPLAVVPVPA